MRPPPRQRNGPQALDGLSVRRARVRAHGSTGCLANQAACAPHVKTFRARAVARTCRSATPVIELHLDRCRNAATWKACKAEPPTHKEENK